MALSVVSQFSKLMRGALGQTWPLSASHDSTCTRRVSSVMNIASTK